jgi:hypothetical protein
MEHKMMLMQREIFGASIIDHVKSIKSLIEKHGQINAIFVSQLFGISHLPKSILPNVLHANLLRTLKPLLIG